MSMNELEAKVAELRELRRMADELADEIAATEDALKAYMTANGCLPKPCDLQRPKPTGQYAR